MQVQTSVRRLTADITTTKSRMTLRENSIFRPNTQVRSTVGHWSNFTLSNPLYVISNLRANHAIETGSVLATSVSYNLCACLTVREKV